MLLHIRKLLAVEHGRRHVFERYAVVCEHGWREAGIEVHLLQKIVIGACELIAAAPKHAGFLV